MHKAGSRKGDVHQVYDKKGADAATKLGLELELKEGTLRSWFADWTRQGKPKPAHIKKSPTKEKPATTEASQAS